MERRLWVDKTRFLRDLERFDHAVLIRPRRFGKTCWALDKLEQDFEEHCQLHLRSALERNPDLFPEAEARRIRTPASINGQLDALFDYAGKQRIPLYVIIDEYGAPSGAAAGSIGDAIRRRTGIRDQVDGEKMVHALLAAHVRLVDRFLIHAETELNKDYADLYLEPFTARYPDAVRHEALQRHGAGPRQ